MSTNGSNVFGLVSQRRRPRVAVIGGGLGGLMAAYLLEKRAPQQCDITIFEASSRLGGKVVTRRFDAAPVIYEAGVAELYDYSQLGPDPLRSLIAEFGLPMRGIDGKTVVIGDRILSSSGDIQRELGPATLLALKQFTAAARRAISPAEFYESDWQEDNKDPLSQRSFRDHLAQLPDCNARRYIEVLVHSDLATEPHLTNAMYGLQNYLMNEPDYLRLYTIEGGIEHLPQALAAQVKAKVLLDHCVNFVEKTPQGLYRLVSRHRGVLAADEFDYVAVALPNNWIPSITWGGAALSEAMHRHHAFYDYPAHYLRVSILFAKPFWQDQINGSYFMLDAFGGCCVYDDSSRAVNESYGVLGWLLAGEAALSMNNCDDATLIEAVLDTLPRMLRDGRRYLVEGRVHRWVGTVNGLPGGYPAREPDSRHQPEPEQHPELFVIGDYLFDSTINGVLDSADVVAEWISEDIASDAVHEGAKLFAAAATPAAPVQQPAASTDLRIAASR
jgi:monoamine oxidase